MFCTVSWFDCTQYLVEHDVHTGPWCVPLLTSQTWWLHKRRLLSVPSHLGGQALQVPFPEIQSLDDTSGGELEQVVRTLHPALVRWTIKAGH